MKIHIHRRRECDSPSLHNLVHERVTDIDVPARSEDQLRDRWPSVHQILLEIGDSVVLRKEME